MMIQQMRFITLLQQILLLLYCCVYTNGFRVNNQYTRRPFINQCDTAPWKCFVTVPTTTRIGLLRLYSETTSRGTKRSYNTNGSNDNDKSNSLSSIEQPQKSVSNSEYVKDPIDHSIRKDHNNIPITIDRILATKPLQDELMTRPGPGGRTLTYLSGDSVTRNLNLIFGYNQWNLHILKSVQTVCIEIDNPRSAYNNNNNNNSSSSSSSNNKLWHVSYSAHVRITHIPSGCYREDIGCGDVMDKSLVVADQNAVKASITDAMKRAARHFGDKLGNSLYDSEFNIQNAPQSLKEALDLYEQERQF